MLVGTRSWLGAAALVLLALPAWAERAAVDVVRTELEAERSDCSMLSVPGFVAIGTDLAASCRVRSMQADSFESCSATCLSQQHCDAVTWFSRDHHVPAFQGTCVGRTAGTDRFLRNDSQATSAFKQCSHQSCGLQRRMDAWCATAQAAREDVQNSTRCIARNVRFLVSSADDFAFKCALAPAPNAQLSMACVDDRGQSLPCRTDVSAVKDCAQSQQGELHDMHRRGCGGLPACLATPGMGRPSPPLATTHHLLQPLREAGAAGQTVRRGNHRLPSWRPKSMGNTRDNNSVLGRLDRFGYLNCTELNDETKGRCRLKSAQYSWLDYAWEGGAQRPVSAAARAVSWWLGEGGTASDPFDAAAFVELLSRMSADPDQSPAQRRPATVYFVGDSTARQQAVSLCCLLRSGLAAAGSPYSADVTVNNPFMTFACKVARRDSLPGARVAEIRFIRCNRGDRLPEWRPLERFPMLGTVLAKAIASTPDVLVLNLGAWNFEDGCRDMHSLHDGLCNGTRPWVLHAYARQWTLLAGALNEAYSPTKRRRSLVLLRTASPRDFEGGKAPVGRCRRTSPMSEAELAEQEERVDPGGMRVSVLIKNLILDAVATQRMPWVRVLDAYEISRARADAHPSRFVTSPPAFRSFHIRYGQAYSYTPTLPPYFLRHPDAPRSRFGLPSPLPGLPLVAPNVPRALAPVCTPRTPHASRFGRGGEDCLHYCLPGVPDVYNGRLLAILEEVGAGIGGNHMGAGQNGALGSRPKNSTSAPGVVLHRFNFRYGELPFVRITKLSGAHGIQTVQKRGSHAQPYTSLSLRLDPSSSAAMLVECPWLGTTSEDAVLTLDNGSLGWCSDLEHFRGV